jgi:hypothetical protein
VLLSFLILGCTQEMEITFYADACEDWDFEVEEATQVVAEKSDEGIVFLRKGVTQSCDASFQPEITAQRRLIQVFEDWEAPAEDDDCETCFFPTVVLHDPRAGDYELQWFEGRDSLTPVGFVSLTVE